MKHIFIIAGFLFILNMNAEAQEKQYKVAGIGFYNFENLFDTLDTPKVRDTEFTPGGSRLWNTRIYQEKLDHLARVVSELGTELSPDGVAILGVAEIENRSVLEDFVAQPKIKNRNYQIVHYDSPDHRGIDVALIYQPKYFQVTGSKAIPLLIYEDNGERKFTRDILLVSGLFDGDTLHVLVNHWPSRSGGESVSQAYRNAGALVCKNVSDSLLQLNPNAKIVIMGDLNDDPTSPSVKKILNAQRKKEKVKKGGRYNPMYDLYKKGIGTLAWRDSWNLFDQIILSYGLVKPKGEGYQYFRTTVYNKKYLVQKTGQFQGYPFRSFSRNTYIGGFSDHFPVYIFLLKEI